MVRKEELDLIQEKIGKSLYAEYVKLVEEHFRNMMKILDEVRARVGRGNNAGDQGWNETDKAFKATSLQKISDFQSTIPGFTLEMRKTIFDDVHNRLMSKE